MVADGESRYQCNTKKQFINRDHLSQVIFIVDVADSRVGEANEVVSARLLQQRDVLQVHLDSLKHLGQIPVVLFRNTSTINTSYSCFFLFDSRDPVFDSVAGIQGWSKSMAK